MLKISPTEDGILPGADDYLLWDGECSGGISTVCGGKPLSVQTLCKVIGWGFKGQRMFVAMEANPLPRSAVVSPGKGEREVRDG